MTVRTRKSMVTFVRPFTLSAFDHPQDPGTYRLVIDEEENSRHFFSRLPANGDDAAYSRELGPRCPSSGFRD